MSQSSKQVVLITGATTGIGRTTALQLAANGFHVIATGRNVKALAELARDGGGARLDTLRLDVTSLESIEAAVAQVNEMTAGRGVDVLINNAGYGLAAPLSEVTDQDFRAQFETNVFGLQNVTRAFLPAMIQRRSGKIINISSIGGRTTFPLFGAYHASKYAVEALSDALRRELRPFGIKVALIEPGPIKTEFGKRTMSEIEKYRSDTSPFAQVYARADQIKEMADKQSVAPERVARVIERAVRARTPAARYVVPFSSRVMLWLLNRLPTSWVDVLMTRIVGLTAKKMAALPAPRAAAPAAVNRAA